MLQAIRTWSRASDREAARQPQEVDDTRAEAAARRARGERERDDAMREGWRLGAHFNNPPTDKGGEGARALTEVPCDHK